MSFACASGSALQAQVANPRPASGVGVLEIPPAEQTDQEWRDQDPNRFLKVRGDFDGDGLGDLASIWIDRTFNDRVLIVQIVQESNPGKWWPVNVEVAFNKLATTGIRLVEPGAYVTACGKGQRECREGEPKTIAITRPSVSLFQHEGGKTFIYWNDESKSWSSVDIDL